MVRLLSIATLILVIVLSPPAVLAVVSNNAVPGDATYPIKRGMEDAIYAVASLNPVTKAWFAKARSDRRFKEITVLLTQGKKASQTLDELVKQTQTAADQIDKVSDSTQKAKLISQLSDSISKYNEGLAQTSKTKPVTAPLVNTTPVPTLAPRSTPLVFPSPYPTTDPELERTRDELERIKKRLEEIERQMQFQNQQNQSSPSQNLTPIITPTPTPTPKPKPTVTVTPAATPRAGIKQNLNVQFDGTDQAGGITSLKANSAGDLIRMNQAAEASGASAADTTPVASSSGSVEGISVSWSDVFSKFLPKIQNLFH